MIDNIYNLIRPRRLSEMFPTSNALKYVKELMESGKLGRSILLHGDSGCGKTTLARIIAKHLNCTSEKDKPCGVCAQCTNAEAWSIMEVNAADERGIDDARGLSEQVYAPPLNSNYMTVILDEAHALSKDAQNMLLKIVEEAPAHLCIILCTTQPTKVIPTLRNRCYQIGFDRLGYSQAMSFIKYTTKRLLDGGYIDKELPMEESTINTIVTIADGSARQLTVLIYIYQTTGTISSAAIVEKDDVVKRLAKVVLGESRWDETAKIIKEIDGDYDVVRIGLANYFSAVALNSTDSKNRYRSFVVLSELNEQLSPTNQKADFIRRLLLITKECKKES